MSRFNVTKRSNGEYQFSLVGSNGSIVLTSEGYSQKSSCKNGITAVKTYSQDESNFDRKISSNGKYYFNLKAANGQIIGTSQMYESEAARENGIYFVRDRAKVSKIVES